MTHNSGYFPLELLSSIPAQTLQMSPDPGILSGMGFSERLKKWSKADLGKARWLGFGKLPKLRVPVKIPAEVLRKKRITETLLRYLQEGAVDKAGKCRAALNE